MRPSRNPTIAAITQGVNNATALARHLGVNRNAVSVRLQYLRARGFIAKCGYAYGVLGRPCIRWRVIEREGV